MEGTGGRLCKGTYRVVLYCEMLAMDEKSSKL